MASPLSGLWAAVRREPAMIVAVGDALLIVAIAFGAPLTAEQKGAVDALLTVIAGIIIRSRVTPVGGDA